MVVVLVVVVVVDWDVVVLEGSVLVNVCSVVCVVVEQARRLPQARKMVRISNNRFIFASYSPVTPVLSMLSTNHFCKIKYVSSTGKIIKIVAAYRTASFAMAWFNPCVMLNWEAKFNSLSCKVSKRTLV